ncbi:Polyketide synthase modules and related protein [Hahella chejuensis KCTC 2396]|uniref:Polyketide synthase modules and related protein n=1 Tax=Hahella chejuensis (strain KCTC 2396) TaxID=349521 RepID=Q2SGJ3_HAHCH|nr:SDR family NAD(P)-dependent oxidoreductase [Hahella chejuensis]ABC30231.1 Polyketide synthase modules and related protein [Hahella chejuensis KCTC 2396]
MEILRRQLTEVAAPPFGEIQAERVLLATDSAEAAEAARHMGAAVLRLDQVADEAAMQAELARIDGGRDIVAVIAGRNQAVASLTQGSWMSHSRRSLELLRWVFAQNRQMRLLSFHSQSDALSALFDGLARSACLEMPRCVFTSARIPSGPVGASLSGRIAAALAWPGRRLRFDESGLRTESWIAAGQGDASQTPFNDGDNIVLIGGAGGVGQELIRVLQSSRRLNLFVLGRKAPDAALTQTLKAYGVKSYLRVDATDYGVLKAAFTHIEQGFGPIKAVFNLAGTLDDCLFHNLSAERLHRTLLAKVGVVLNLAALQQDYRPQYVVNFSSLTATLGNIGQCAYGAANEFVELASEQLPNWYSFAWGLWRSQGMQMTDGSALRPMEPGPACERMLSALVTGERHLVIYDGAAEGMAALRGDREAPARETQSQAAPDSSAPVAPMSVSSMSVSLIDKDALEEKTRRWLKDIVRRHSGLKTLKDDDNLLDKGLDSVASIQISTDIAAQLSPEGDFKLSRAILFECSTIRQLAEHLMERAQPLLCACLADTDGAATAQEVDKIPAGQAQTAAVDNASDATKTGSELVKTHEGDTNPAVTNEPKLSPDAYRDDDIAIVGMAGEFPNGATPDAFWRSLADGEDAVRVIPQDRWDWRRDYSASAAQADAAYGRHGGFMAGVAEFDPAFFNIAPVDAALLDPQERRFLQVSYHALEDAGYFASPTQEVGVFAAAMFGHYQDLDAPGRVVSSSFAAIANRVSYAFDLQGPSLTVDTMCSGSLTALHMACNSLRLGDCRMALAGGVNIMAHPGKYRLLSQGKFLSASGHCHAFGVEADGYVPGEGAAVVVLKTVADAVRDQDVIYAIVRATAINSGGKTSSFTVPSARAQQRVIQDAIRKSGVNPAQVNYIEAHGAGTSLGDPIELQALQNAYGADLEGADAPCYLGSVKSNIGHLESAAAMAGLFKVVQQFAHEQLAPTLHCAIENPYLNIEQTRFQLVREKQHWPLAGAATRFAGLSSFGAGGANGHVVLQQYLAREPAGTAPAQSHYLIALSAPNRSGLRRVKQQLAAYLRAQPQINLYSLSYTLCCARQHHAERECYVVESASVLIDSLESADSLQTDSPQTNSPQTNSPANESLASLMRAYLQGDRVDFAPVFPVKSLLRGAPKYPFARDLYWAPTLQAEAVSAATDSAKPAGPSSAPRPDSTPAVLLTPVWRHTEPPTLSKPIPLVAVMAPSEQALPTLIDGARVLRIRPGAALSFQHDVLTLRPDRLEDFTQALDYIAHELNQEEIYWINGNVSWSDASALNLAKAMQACSRPCVILNVNDSRQTPESIAMGGVFRVLALENTHVSYRQAQIAKPAGSWELEDWRWLLAEQAETGDEFKEVERREGEQRERSLTCIEPAQGARLRQEGVYLISGGMGMIGKEIAQRLQADYNANVILVGRSALSPEREAWLQQWPQGEISYQQADIADPVQAQRLIADVLQKHSCLHGVIQSAGVLKDAQVQNKSLADFSAVMAAKVEGTRQLDRCTAHLELDFFCLFSSMSSIMGNVGQCDYVAANRFLDEFAAERNRLIKQGARKGHTLSINWPLWIDDQDSENLMDQYRSLADYLRRHYGFSPLTLAQGAAFFITWINGVADQYDQVMGLVGDQEKIRERFTSTTVQEPKQQAKSASQNPSQAVASEAQIQAGLTRLVQALTRLSEEDISADKSWGDLGLNSVMMQTLAQDIGKTFGAQVPPNALFSYNNIQRLAEYLLQQGATLADAAESDDADAQTEAALSGESSQAAVVASAPQTSAEGRSEETVSEQGFAIIGMSGVMPGAADLDAFWELLTANRSAIRRVERWGDKNYYAGTIDDIERFDARFFGLSAREAMLMDPQHRLFLQTSYNALTDAGYAPALLSNVGVFAGVQFNDYQTLLQTWGQSSHPYAATGNAHAMLANRVSYLLNFNGPSQTIDTACSSALVAVNRGVMSLQRNECDVALVGAVSLLIDPAISDAAQSMGVLSPDYRCATFDDGANGYVRAEGVGCVVIKRLADAQRDGDSIYGVIEASAENHGGRANSLTAPNPQAQSALLQKAYTPELAQRVSYIETHGTGTQLGDPIEIDALHQAFRALAPNRREGSIALGAVKSNIGHLEPAAGMASLLKVLLCLQHRRLPANIHFHRLNPMIRLNEGPFRLLTENCAWEAAVPRVAGISSFGFGGSNAHVIVSEGLPSPVVKRAERPCWLVTLSAKTPYSLACMKAQLLDRLHASDHELADIAFTLNTGREAFPYRLSWIARSTVDLVEQIRETDAAHQEKCAGKTSHWTPERSQNDWTAVMLEAQAQYQQGALIDWTPLFTDGAYRRLHLPGYVFDTKPYWFEQAADSAAMKEVNHGS